MCTQSGFATLNKKEFIHTVDTAVQAENKRILSEREKLESQYEVWKEGRPLSRDNVEWVLELAKTYKVKDDNFSAEEWHTLLNCVDSVPLSLAVAQAINESGWGRSRFAKKANNYYGQWCYTPGCGLVPLKRPSGATYEVKKFPSLNASVAGYMKNLNSNRAYRRFRELRSQLRKDHKKVTGLALVNCLSNYSQSGKAYPKYLINIIKSNQLQVLDE